MIEKEEDGQRRQRKSRRTSKADAAKLKPTLFVGSLSKSRRSWERAADILRKNLPADPPKDTMWQERQAPDIATKREERYKHGSTSLPPTSMSHGQRFRG